MNVREFAFARGEYLIEGEDIVTGEKFSKRFHNVVVQNFFSQVFSALRGGTPVLNVTHLAIGTGTTAVAKSDTALQTEIFRKAPSVTPVITATTYTIKINVAAGEAVGTWGEIGIIINGTDMLGTGTLLSHANMSYAKSSSVQYTITFTLTLQ